MAQAATRTRKKPATAVVAPARKAKAVPPFEMLTEVDDDGYFTAKVFGEEFKFDSEINGMLQLFAGSGRNDDIVRFVESVLAVDPINGETFDEARNRVRSKFLDVTGRQRGFTIENAAGLINEITSAAGNDSEE